MAKGSADRFYLMEFRKDRPVFWGDIGSKLTIEGLIVGGENKHVAFLLPDVSRQGCFPIVANEISTEDWSDFIRFSDDPQILTDLTRKIFQRKLRYNLSGEVQQKVWAADGFCCKYCGRVMGEVLLTVDHFIPLELGGANNISNYITSCRRCNKDKGSQHPKDWLETRHSNLGTQPSRSYDGLCLYLERRKL